MEDKRKNETIEVYNRRLTEQELDKLIKGAIEVPKELIAAELEDPQEPSEYEGGVGKVLLRALKETMIGLFLVTKFFLLFCAFTGYISLTIFAFIEARATGHYLFTFHPKRQVVCLMLLGTALILLLVFFGILFLYRKKNEKRFQNNEIDEEQYDKKKKRQKIFPRIMAIIYLLVFLVPFVESFVHMSLHGELFDGYYLGYEVNEDGETCTITTSEMLPHVKDFCIPEEIKGYRVTHIKDFAFYGCDNLVSVTIPDSVTDIGDGAFASCDNLASVTVDENNTVYQSIDGNVYSKGGTELVVYALDKKNKNVVIPDFVTAIGEAVFYESSNLESITIGNSATTIGNKAFYKCSKLANVTLGDSVTTIGDSAFYRCKKLTHITIPNSVTTIGNEAFCECSKLESVTIDNIAATIGKSAFSDCHSSLYHSYESGNYVGDNTNPYAVLIEVTERTLTAYEIHPDTKLISYGVFEACKQVKDITIPDGVMAIGPKAFYDCLKLMDITIPVSVTVIGDEAFQKKYPGDSDINALTYYFAFIQVHYAGSKEQWKQITIGSDNSKLNAASIDYNNSSTPSSPTIKEPTTSKLSYKVNDDGKTCTITGIGGCTEKDLCIETHIDGYEVTGIGDYAFSWCSKFTSVTIPDSVTSIGNSAFYHCKALTSITIPDSVTSIGKDAFYWCEALRSVTVGENVTSIGEDAFWDCDKLVEVINKSSLDITAGSTDYGRIAYYAMEVHNGTTKIVDQNDYLFYPYSGVNYLLGYVGTDTELTLPESYNGQSYEINNRAFYNCSSLTSIIISEGVTGIGEYAFTYCNALSNFGVDNDNTVYQSIDGNLYSKDGKTLIAYARGKRDASFIIPDGVTSIGEYAFRSCGALTNITISDSVTSIGAYAFFDCDGLTSIIIPNAVTSIGSSAFSSCGALTSITIPDSVTSIGSSAFYSCGALTSITIPDSVTSIGSSAFSSCGALTSICFDGTVEQWNTIKKELFWNLGTATYTIYCTDGTIAKNGTIIYH